MEKSPLVSLIIPVYNGSNYVKEAIDSALAQTYKNLEIIVVNDGSKDNTEEICKSYGNKIRYFSKENGGVASALNLGISKMKGEYFSWLSHDDKYDKNKIMYQVKALQNINDKYTVIGCNHLFIDKKGDLLYKDRHLDNRDEYKTTHALKYLFSGYVQGCDLLIHKDIFNDVGTFDINLPTTQDFDLWFKIFKKYKLLILPEYLVFSRSHEEQGSKAGIDNHVKECDSLWIGFDKKLSSQEKKRIYGSEYLFYKNIFYKLNKDSLYEEAKKYYRIKYINSIGKHLDLYEEKESLFPISNNELCILLKEQKNKTRLFFPVYGSWSDRGGLTRIVSVVMNNLVEMFDVYLLTFGDYGQGYKLNEKIKKLILNKEFTNEQILNLQLLLQIDVYIGSINCVFPYYYDYLLCKKYNIKTIAWNHEFYFLPYYFSEFSDVVSNRNKIYQSVDIVLWLNSFSGYAYQMINNNGMVLRNPLSLENKNQLINSPKDSDILIAVGRFDDPRKNLDLLLHIFAKVLQSNSHVKLNILGNYDLELYSKKYKKTIREIIAELKLDEKNLKFLGHVNNPEEYYKNASVNLMPSYWEGFGLIINEAGLHSVPSIVFDGSGFEDLIDNNKSGYIIEKGNIEEYASRIIELLDDQDKLQLFGQNALLRTENYDIAEVIKIWEDLINKLLTVDNITDYIHQTYPIIRENEKKTIEQIICIYEDICANNINIQSKQNKVGHRGKLKKSLKIFRQSLKQNGLKLTLIKIKNKIAQKVFK